MTCTRGAADPSTKDVVRPARLPARDRARLTPATVAPSANAMFPVVAVASPDAEATTVYTCPGSPVIAYAPVSEVVDERAVPSWPNAVTAAPTTGPTGPVTAP